MSSQGVGPPAQGVKRFTVKPFTGKLDTMGGLPYAYKGHIQDIGNHKPRDESVSVVTTPEKRGSREVGSIS
jgi:hypothetical protein